jgi:hypothetical protein
MRRHSLATALFGSSLIVLVCAHAQAQTTVPAQPGTEPPAAPVDPNAAPPPAAQEPPAPAPEPSPPPPAPVAPAAPEAPPATAPTGEDSLASAHAAAIESELAETSTEGEEFRLDVYGFSDFTYQISLEDDGLNSEYNSFAIGNLNVYLASKLGDSWQSMAEVRFSYLPHGSGMFDPGAGAFTRTDTSTSDYTIYGRATRWGGIVIERAYLEYLAHPLLNVRAGHFLTPYGIWNVDHGSPVIVPVHQPFIVGEALLPRAQTGLEIYGAHLFDPIRVGYHFTLSNGRGPIDTYQDLNHEPGLGGRLFAQADSPAGTFTLGVSGYTGAYTDRSSGFEFDDDGNLVLTDPVTADYDEASLAGDLKWEFEGLLVQAEAMMNDVAYDEVRPPATLVVEGPPGFQPDFRRFGGYGMVGYRFSWGGIMPFLGYDYYDDGGSGPWDEVEAVWGGVNVRPTARVALKAQYTFAWFPDDPPGLNDDTHYNAIELQAAWSF